MAKCTVCGKFVSAKGGSAATCCKCANKFHLPCVGLSEAGKLITGWRCQGCKEKSGKNYSRPTPIKGIISEGSEGTPTSLDDPYESTGETTEQGDENLNKGTHAIPSNVPDLAKEINLLREDLRSMKDELKAELREFRLEVADLRQSMASQKKKVENLESRLLKLEEQQTVASPNEMVNKLEKTVDQLRSELNDREQDLLLSDIEISNLPEDAGENVMHTVELIARKLGVDLDARDIVFAERVGPKIDKVDTAGPAEPGRKEGPTGVVTRGRRIVVSLVRRTARDELLRAARVRRGATSADLGFAAPPRRFYVNERLTRTNRQLLYRAKQAAARLDWKFTWTKRGRVLTRQENGKPTHSIRNEQDLERVFGREALGDNRP